MLPATLRRTTTACLAAGLVLMSAGCIPTERAGFDAASPSRRLDAIVQASAPDSDPATLARLIEQLESQDPAARMLAIRALESRTGQTMGYIHTDPKWQRQLAVDRWVDSLESGDLVSDLGRTAGDDVDIVPMNP